MPYRKTKGSNRTFMELKYFREVGQRIQIASSNRTFMELKSDYGVASAPPSMF